VSLLAHVPRVSSRPDDRDRDARAGRDAYSGYLMIAILGSVRPVINARRPRAKYGLHAPRSPNLPGCDPWHSVPVHAPLARVMASTRTAGRQACAAVQSEPFYAHRRGELTRVLIPTTVRRAAGA